MASGCQGKTSPIDRKNESKLSSVLKSDSLTSDSLVPACVFHNNDVLCEGEHQLKEQLGVGFYVLMNFDLPVVVDNADIHFSGMQIDPAVISVLLFVESHNLAFFG